MPHQSVHEAKSTTLSRTYINIYKNPINCIWLKTPISVAKTEECALSLVFVHITRPEVTPRVGRTLKSNCAHNGRSCRRPKVKLNDCEDAQSQPSNWSGYWCLAETNSQLQFSL